jgi:hypothetical protein
LLTSYAAAVVMAADGRNMATHKLVHSIVLATAAGSALVHHFIPFAVDTWLFVTLRYMLHSTTFLQTCFTQNN